MNDCKNCKIRPFGIIKVTREGFCVECGARICSPAASPASVVPLPLSSCDNDHEEIFFSSPFRALCPLCAMRVKLTEEFQQELAFEVKRKEEAEDDASYHEQAKERAIEAMHKAEEALEAYKREHP